MKLIALVTNLAYYGRLSTLSLPIAGTPLGPLAVFVPVAGCLIIGLMARFGSEKIRGHGIPEAMEAILIGSSRIQPKVRSMASNAATAAMPGGAGRFSDMSKENCPFVSPTGRRASSKRRAIFRAARCR